MKAKSIKGKSTEEIKAALSEKTILLDTGAAIANRVSQLVADWREHVEGGNNTFISTRELSTAQIARLVELGFDQHHCWPMPITT